MSHDLVPIPSGLTGAVERRADRHLLRQLSDVDRSKSLAIAKVEARAQEEAARAHAVGYVGQQAMHAVTMVSQLEGQLGTVCPLAVARLQGIADMTALSIAQVVGDASRRLS